MEKAGNEKSLPSSHASSRRTSGTLAREQLPTPPPNPRHGDCPKDSVVFVYPPLGKEHLPAAYHSLLDYAEREDDFYASLHRAIEADCGQTSAADAAPSQGHGESEAHSCATCQQLRDECSEFMDPLLSRLGTSVTAALAAYGAVEQLTRLYALWDQYSSVEREWRQRRECEQYVHLLHDGLAKVGTGSGSGSGAATGTGSKAAPSDPDDGDLEQSLALLDSILETGRTASMKRGVLKQQRERSKSVMVDDMYCPMSCPREVKGAVCSWPPHQLRRQSTYSEGKSKVSKWTKVKAAFKWERANMPALAEHRDVPNAIGLTPVNHEVARYLRVPSVPCGAGSSADSILSSSSGGHVLSEVGTPGTISSASSMDDIDGGARNGMRRGSSKSDTRIVVGDMEASPPDYGRQESTADELKPSSSDSGRNFAHSKSSSVKSFRKPRAVSDFEVLPEDVIADIKSTSNRRAKAPPSPLNLDLKQDLNDLECFYSPLYAKSPHDRTQSLPRSKKIGSPGNSSVPSSPSRHSDFFPDYGVCGGVPLSACESEELSSGDFSEPCSPNHVSARQAFHTKQDEINQRYLLLRAKLDKEFENKRREWNKIKSNPNACRAITLVSPPKSSEEHSPNPALNCANLSAKLLEENLTPDFKKKLRKWRVKKQVSLGGTQCAGLAPTSPSRDAAAAAAVADTKGKIDWHLWKTGQLKLEGQGLCVLPDQKDLPEEFQKKLEQWNKLKRGGSIMGGTDSLKRSAKLADGSKGKGPDEDRLDKHKPYEKDKMEKLAKLKAIVSTDHTAKEIEVKTSAGVMKFEGISRKFTRKLYEWEKARGIGPESSTFALLHPGYCPIDVGRIPKESHNAENSPNLSRSLSLDSISPNIALPAISHQASSLSLNDVNELKEMECVNSCDPLGDGDFKKYEEPEAVMVEVEDHIVETASPLVMAHAQPAQQMPVYKYEEGTCNDYCNSRRIQSFESKTNLAPLLSALQRADEVFAKLRQAAPEMAASAEIGSCETTLALVRAIYPHCTDNLMKPNVSSAVLDVQDELGRICELSQKSPLDEACCRETMEERSREYSEEFKGLHDALDVLKQSLRGGVNGLPKDMIPDISVTSEDAPSTGGRFEQLSPTLEAADERSGCSYVEEEPNALAGRNFNGSNGGNGGTGTGASKKKLRLRKVGSRQNSKTESDSSCDDAPSVAMETPRRLKRKNFRLKQRSFDDDYWRSEERGLAAVGNDFRHMLKSRPHAEPSKATKSSSSLALSSTQGSVQLEPSVLPIAPNIFVKTKRKLFTTVEEPTASDGIAVVVRDVGGSQADLHQTDARDQAARPTNVPRRHRSFSSEDLREELRDRNERQCHSADSVRLGERGVRTPLASDSFPRIDRIGGGGGGGGGGEGDGARLDGTTPRKQHLFKKNPDKGLAPSKTTVRKIETRIARNHSGSSLEQSGGQLPDKTDNTLPKIWRKLERNSLTPTTMQPAATAGFEFPSPPDSGPATPSSVHEVGKPRTPLSERALRLQRAKEEFLKDSRDVSAASTPNCQRRRGPHEIGRNDTGELYRRSDSHATGDEDSLLKSLSVETFSTETPAQSDADGGIYDSLPRNVSRSGKISSKLGFATLASKLRRAKCKKEKTKTTTTTSATSANSALSALCRQTLLADVIAVPQFRLAAAASPTPDGSADGGAPRLTESVMKSQSSPLAATGGAAGLARGVGAIGARSSGGGDDRLNKSQSEQYVKWQKKESYV